MNYSLDVRFLPTNLDDEEPNDENHDSGHDGANDGSGGDRDSSSDEDEEDINPEHQKEPPNFKYKTGTNKYIFKSDKMMEDRIF